MAGPLAQVLRSLGSVLNDDPLIGVIDGLEITEAAVELRAAATTRLAASTVSSAVRGIASAGRTSHHAWVAHDTSPLIDALAREIAAHVARPLNTAEAFQVVRYEPGQRYRAHFDAYDLDTPRGQRTCHRQGQRLITTILYLDEVSAGGATSFPRLGLSVSPRLGRLLVFENCIAGSNRRHEKTLHEGEPVEEGEKWIANLWFRERA